MELPDFDYVKKVLLSILTSCQNSLTISQVLKDYELLEGVELPYCQLGFATAYELLKSMNDIIKIPRNPNMNSIIKLIVSDKTTHIRELVINQKNKRSHPRKSSNNSQYRVNKIKNNILNNYNTSQYNKNTYRHQRSTRGYDNVKTQSNRSQNHTGIVTDELRSCVEDLCGHSQKISIPTLKHCIISHPDFKKMNTHNIEEAINMLKYFIYIDKGGVHLKDSRYEIFQSNKSSIMNKPLISKVVDFVNNIDTYGDIAQATTLNTTNNLNFEDDTSQSKQSSTMNLQPKSNVDKDNFIDSFDEITQTLTLNTTNKFNTNNESSENGDIFIEPKINENINESSISTTKPIPDSIFKVELKSEKYEASIFKTSNNTNIDYKHMIATVIKESKVPITVMQSLQKFKNKFGFSFPFQQLACRTCMDFFRLYPYLFKLDNQYSTNSIIKVIEQIIPPRTSTVRSQFINASLIHEICDNDNSILEEFDSKISLKNTDSSILDESDTKTSLNNTDIQEHDECNGEIQCSTIKYEKYDSDMILDSMKTKFRYILSKYDNGIPCHEFMDMYADTFSSRFDFCEYEFESMKDMAYQLPSIFFVKDTDDGDCILYEASKREQFKTSNDPLLYYKNIPKTVLHNLSNLFDKYRNGIDFEKLLGLYCSEFGRAYEPLRYGYSSERHMFESLIEMVKIQNNKVYTINPFAYTPTVTTESLTYTNTKDSPVFPMKDFLSYYSGTDICNGKFVYSEMDFYTKNPIRVVVAEIYTPGSFFIQLASQVDNISNFMNNLQVFYNENEEKYTVLPELIITGLACTSCFEDTKLWHRATVLNIIDKLRVELLYVDYGSIEIVWKSNIRLLASQFGLLPIQALHCSLFEYGVFNNYNSSINKLFVEKVDEKILEANLQKSKTLEQKTIVQLFLKKGKKRTSVNKLCAQAIQKQLEEDQKSLRTVLSKMDEPECEK